MKIGQTISHYKILEEIGHGGMGVVYKARDVKLNRFVALKFLPEQLTTKATDKARFLQEAQAASAINHPNVCIIHDIQEYAGGQFIVMEYVEGITLRETIKNENLAINNVIEYSIQIAEALGIAHKKGIIHRDIKSENIMVNDEKKIKVMDFGLARIKGAARLTRTSTTAGTAAYMSPEQIQGQEVDARSDIFSLGVVLYEMLTGQLPFRGEYESAMLYSIINEEPIPIKSVRQDVPDFLEQIILQCLEKDPKNRPASALELNQALSNATSLIAEIPVQKPKIKISKSIFILTCLTFLLLIAIFFHDVILNHFVRPVIPPEQHVTVLPLTNISGNKNDQAFCDGLGEIITSSLSSLERFREALSVVPFSEVRQLNISSAAQARQHFNVNLVISGSLQRNMQRIQLTLNLVDALKVRIISSVVLSYDSGNIATFQDEIISRLIDLIKVSLLPAEQKLLTTGYTQNSDAYNLYVQGRGFLLDYDRMENIETAIQLFTRALDLDSRFVLAHASLGEAFWRKYVMTRDTAWVAPAIINAEQAKKLNAELAHVQVTLGIIYGGTGKYDLAGQALQAAMQSDPTNADAYRELARVYQAEGNSNKVEETYLKAIELKPNYWANYYYLASFYYQKGDYAHAQQYYSKVTKLSPKNYRAFRNVGAIHLLEEQYDQAEYMLQKSIDIEPNYGAYSNLGVLYFTLQRYREAATMFEKATEMNNKYYAVWGNLAYCYDQIPEKADKVVPTLEYALSLAQGELNINPNDAYVFCDMAGYYAHIKNEAKAIQYLNKALKLKSDHVEFMFTAAQVHYQFGNVDTALQYIEELLKVNYSIQRIERSPELQHLLSDKKYLQLKKQYRK